MNTGPLSIVSHNSQKVEGECEGAEVETLPTPKNGCNVEIVVNSMKSKQECCSCEEALQHRDDVIMVSKQQEEGLDSPPSLAASTNGSSISGRGNEEDEDEDEGQLSPRSVAFPTKEVVAEPSVSYVTQYYMRVDDLHLHTPSPEKQQHECEYFVPHPAPREVCSNPAQLPLYVGLDATCKNTPQPQPSMHLSSITTGLVQLGLRLALHSDNHWTPYDSKTAAFTKSQRTNTNNNPNPKKDTKRSAWFSRKSSSLSSSSSSSKDPTEDQVMLWTGTLPLPPPGTTASTLLPPKQSTLRTSYHGYDIPAVKSRGILPLSSKNAALFLLDSSKVPTYNKSSKGRTDVVVFSEELDSREGVVKVCKSRAKPPLLPATLEFWGLLHGRKLDDNPDAGFIIVSRALWRSKECATHEPNSNEEEEGEVISGEVLLNVHIVRPLPGRKEEDVCEVVNVNHLKSPSMVPNFVAKKVGLSAAVGFIQDLRAVCK